MLQWREQLIADEDVLSSQVANQENADAFEDLAVALIDDRRWQSLL
ncbi:hypothetical protein [Kitasatospora sp. NBC_01266]|nr:hypothetical protein [Kitasatospora sp. NBC_01266]